MSWPAPFIAALSAPTLTPYVRLEFLSMPTSVDSSGVAFSNNIGEIRGTISKFSRWSGSCTPAPCSVGTGGFDVTVAGNMRGALDDLNPGSLAILWVHPTGDASAAELWAAGPLESVMRSGMKEEFTMRFGDLLTALYTRLSEDAGTLAESDDSLAGLFHKLNTGAIVFSGTSSVTVGTTGQLQATSGAGDFDRFEREDSQKGLLKILTKNGEETLLEWDNKASSTLLNMSGTGPQRGGATITWSTFLGSNPARVYPMVRITDHPGVIFLKLLASSGTVGTTSIYDVLPSSFGFDPGATLFSLVDDADISAWIQEVMVATTGNYIDIEWDVIADATPDNALKWITDPLLQVGIFPVMRQGKITLRALQDLNPATTRQPHGLKTTGLTITDADIIEIGQWSYPSPDQEAVARFSEVITAEVYDGSTFPTREGDPKTYEDSYSSYRAERLPAVASRSHDLSTVLFDTGSSSQVAAAEGDAARLLCWDALCWERIHLKVHVRFAQVCKGDVITITSDKLYGALMETRYGYDGQAMMVVSVRDQLLPPEGPAVWLELLTVTIPPE